jgi:hypothetical protein
MTFSHLIDKPFLIFAIITFMAISCSADAPREAGEPPERIQALYGIAEELRTAILQKDIETLLKYIVIGPDGFESREQAMDLFAADNPIGCLLFDSQCRLEYLREHGGETNPYRISVLEFFEHNPRMRIRIRLLDPPNHRVQVFYVAEGSRYDATYPSWTGDPSSLEQWGKQFVYGCMKYTDSGWRYDSADAGIFFCGGD